MNKTLKMLLEKPLTNIQRRKRSIIMKRAAPKIARKRKIALSKKANPEALEKRARKAAIEVIRKKLLKDKKYNDLSFAEKTKVDKFVEKKKGAIEKIARRLLPKIKKAEAERLSKMQSGGEDK